MTTTVTPRCVRALAALAAALLLASAGCGPVASTEAGMKGDAHEISVLLDEMNDARSDPKAAEALFVAGKVPPKAEFKKYSKYGYYLHSEPSVGSDLATIPIMLTDESNGGEQSTIDWTFKKEGDGWKIESAPLP